MTRYKCPACGRVYNDHGTVPPEAIWCSDARRHERKRMVAQTSEHAEYQAILDEMGVPADDPLRFAD